MEVHNVLLRKLRRVERSRLIDQQKFEKSIAKFEGIIDRLSSLKMKINNTENKKQKYTS